MSYNIKITPNYYIGTINAPQAYLAKEYGDEILVFGTEQEAQDAIDEMVGDGPYYCSHGEAGRPSYEIIENGDYGPDCIKGTYKNEIDPGDLPDDIYRKLDVANVEYDDAYSDEYDTYSYTIDDGDKRYGIHYTVSTITVQVNANDLGGINWCEETYTCEVRSNRPTGRGGRLATAILLIGIIFIGGELVRAIAPQSVTECLSKQNFRCINCHRGE